MSEEIKKQLQDLLRKLLSQGLPEEEAIKMVEAEKQKLLGLEKTKGVVRPAATAAPKKPAAVTGLQSGTSLSESQRLVAPIAQAPAQKDKPEGYIDYFKAEDLLENEEDINSKFKGQLNSLGIQIDEANIGNGIILSSGSGKFIPNQTYGGGSRDLNKSNKVKVGPKQSTEYLTRQAKVLNDFLNANGNKNYTTVARNKEGNPELYQEYLKNISIADAELNDDNLLFDELTRYEKFIDIENSQGIEYGAFQFKTNVDPLARTTAKKKLPFRDEKDKARYLKFKEEGVMPDYTEKELEDLKQAKKTEYASNKSDDFAYNLTSTQRKDLGAIAWSEQNELQKSVDEFEKNYETHEKISLPALDKAIKNFLSNPTSRELHTKAKDLQVKFIEETNRLQEKQIALSTNAKEKEFLPLAVSDFLANYNRLAQLRTSFKSLGTDILYTTLQIAQVSGVGTGETQAMSSIARQMTPAQRNKMLEGQTGIITLSERIKKETESFQRPIEISEVKTTKDFGRWVAGSSTNLIPSLTMAFTGPAALPLFGLSGAGSAGIDIAIKQKNAADRLIKNREQLQTEIPDEVKIEIESQIKKDEKTLNLTNSQQLSIQALYAVSEIAFERLGTISLLKGVKSALKSLPPTTIKEGFKFAGTQLGKGVGKEGGSELATTITQNFGDIFILDEDKNLFEGGLESFAQGALMGSGIAGGPVGKAVKEAVAMSLATRSELNKMKEITEKLRELTGITSLQNAPDSNIKMPNQSPEVQKLVEELTGEMSAIKFNIVARLGVDISIEQAYELGGLNREMRKINKRFEQLSSNTDLSPTQLAAAEKELKARYDNLIGRREDILTDKDLKEETKALADATSLKFEHSLGYQIYETRMLNSSELNLADQYNSLSKSSKQSLYNQAKKDLRKNSVPYARLTEKQIKDQAFKSYIDNSYKERIEKGEANSKAYAESNGLDVNFVKVETTEEAVQALKDAGAAQADVKAAKANLEAGNLEAMQEGNTIIVHMPNAINNKRIGVFAHELLHIQAKIKYGADNVTQAGKDLLAYLKRNDKDLHARVKFRIDGSYKKKNPEGEIVENEDYYEEAMNAMSDVIADGQLLKSNSLNAIRGFANNYLPTKFKFKENEKQAVFNFVKDFNKSAHYGKAPVKLENVLDKAISKTSGTKFSKTTAKEIDDAYSKGDGAFQIAMMYEPLVTKLSQKYRNVPDFSVLKEDLIQNALYEKGGVIDLINSFDGRGALSGYVGRLLPLRMNKFAGDLFGQKFTDDVTERVDVAAAETLPEQVEREEIQQQEAAVAKTQEKRNILDRANLSSELQVKALEAATKTLGTLLPQIDIKKGKNFREKYKIAVRNMLYEDVSNELRSFNDNDYYGYIKLNAKSLYEIMPLADLTKSQALKNLFLEQQFDKDGKPIRVLESFTGKKSYAGNLVFKKKPWTEVEKAFNSEFAIKHSNNAQRKAFIINTLAKEIAFDESMEALNNPTTQEKIPLTQETEINEFIQEFEMNIQRGRFTKYSITLKKHLNKNPETLDIILKNMSKTEKLAMGGIPYGDAFVKVNAFISELDKEKIKRELNNQFLNDVSGKILAEGKATNSLLFSLMGVDNSIYTNVKGNITLKNTDNYRVIGKNLFEQGILTPELLHNPALKTQAWLDVFGFKGKGAVKEMQDFFEIEDNTAYDRTKMPSINRAAAKTNTKDTESIFKGIKEFINENNPERLGLFVSNAKANRPIYKKLMLDLIDAYHNPANKITPDFIITMYSLMFEGGTRSAIRNTAMLVKIQKSFAQSDYPTLKGVKINTRPIKKDGKTIGTNPVFSNAFPGVEGRTIVPEHMAPIKDLQFNFFYKNGKNNLYNALLDPINARKKLSKAIDIVYEKNGVYLIESQLAEKINETAKETIPNEKLVNSRLDGLAVPEEFVDFPGVDKDIDINFYSNDGFFAKETTQENFNNKIKLSITKRAQAKSKLIKDMVDRKSTRAQSVKSGADLAIAERLGEKANAYNRGIFGQLSIPYNAEDWQGLLYNLAGKGEQGNTDLKLLKELLIDPYTLGVSQLETERLETMANFKNLKAKLRRSPERLGKKLDELNLPMFTVQDAIRIYAFANSGHDIPKLSKTNKDKLIKYIESNPDLRSFAFGLTRAIGKEGYIKPDENWQRANIGIDLANSINKVRRPKALSAWTKNLEIILNPTNRAKLTAALGSDFISTLDKTIARMKSGTNRKPTGDPTVDAYQDFVNGSVGTIMFFNMRSATLQTISAVNFINWSDNNPLAAGKAFLNVPQFASDFKTLFYSDYLKSRRKGLKINIQESELMDAVTKSNNPLLAATSYLLRIGFTPTQVADSLAITFGGAPFYRNRINSYVKQGMSKEKAEQTAYQDWRGISNESQQSSDPSRISEIQSTNLGRLIFAFGNTPFQYTRIGKRALQDLINRRGDARTNVSKIVYYFAAQNYMFNALQNALFAAEADDEELTETQKKFKTAKYNRMYNNMANSVLRGTGMTGAVLAAVKDAGLKYYKLKNKENQFFADYGEISDALLAISPPVSHKQRKVDGAAEAGKYDSKFPPLLVGISEAAAVINIPLDRLLRKTENIMGALNSDYDNWVRIFMFLGWSEYELLPQKAKTTGGPSSLDVTPSSQEATPSNLKVEPSAN